MGDGGSRCVRLGRRSACGSHVLLLARGDAFYGTVHGGAIRVDSVEKRLWVPSEEDEASARAVLARLSGDAAAGDDPSAAGSAPVWEFEDGPSGSGAWRRFDADGAAQAESARGGQFCFGRGSGTYFVDTGAMTQTNVETSVSRRIRRRLA